MVRPGELARGRSRGRLMCGDGRRVVSAWCGVRRPQAKERREAARALASGNCRLAVGTHALLSQPDFVDLGLVVLDESHK